MIYITHCSAKKDENLQETGAAVTPDILYASLRIRRFMRTCKAKGVSWAILSDCYGIWFPHEEHAWYEKDPSTLTEEEFGYLLTDFDEKLKGYRHIRFYHNPGRFHRHYRKILQKTRLKDRISLFSHIREIA